MAFPTIPTTGNGRIVSSQNLSPAGTHTFDWTGLTKNAGELVIAIVIQYDGNTTNAEYTAWGDGFTEFVDQAGAATMAIGAAYLFCDGTESGTFTVTSADTSTNDSVCILMSIAGAHASTPPEGGTMTTSAAPADIASFNPTGWDVEDTLWIAVAGSGETATTGTYTGLSAAPTNYTNYFDTGITADVVGGVEGAVAFRQLAAASDDPDGFSGDASNTRNAALLIAVRPGATTDAAAENVPVTVTANSSSGVVSTNTSLDSVTVTANDAGGNVSLNSENAPIGVTAFDATITTESGGDGNADAECAEVGVTSFGPSGGTSAHPSMAPVNAHSRTEGATDAFAVFAAVSVVAFDASGGSRPVSAGAAALSAIANQPAINIQPNAGNALVTVTANGVTGGTRSVNAGNAAVSTVVNNPTETVSTTPATAPVNAVAFDATVSTASMTNAPAGVAAVSVVANQASGKVQLSANNVAITTTANNATGRTSLGSGFAPVTATSFQPTRTTSLGSGHSAVSATANNPTGKVSTTPTTAPVGVTAFNATVSTETMTNANAGFAAVTVVANNSTGRVSLGAGNAALSAISNQPSITLRVNAANTQVTAVSNIPTVTKAVTGDADVASVTALANQVLALIRPVAGFAPVTVTANDGSNFVPEPLPNPPFIIRDGDGLIIKDAQPGVVIIKNREGLGIQNSSDAFIIRDGP